MSMVPEKLSKKKKMSTVPANWIQNGVLHWPRQISKQRFYYKKQSDPMDDRHIYDENDILKEGAVFPY